MMAFTYQTGRDGIPMDYKFKFDEETLKQARNDTGDETDKSPKEDVPKKRSRRSSTEKHSADECTQKIHQLWMLTHRTIQSQLREQKESEFVELGADISRLSQKYAIVSVIITSLAPVFVAVGLVNKWYGFGEELVNRWKERKKVIDLKKTQKPNGESVYEYKPGESSRTFPNPPANFQ